MYYLALKTYSVFWSLLKNYRACLVEIVVVLSFALCNSSLIHKFFHVGKTICADRLKEIVENNECLIYSFGNPTTNLTFELAMLKMGCTVKMGFCSKLGGLQVFFSWLLDRVIYLMLRREWYSLKASKFSKWQLFSILIGIFLIC